MKNNSTNQPVQPAKQLKLKKESIALLSTPRSSLTDGPFSPTATCHCIVGG